MQINVIMPTFNDAKTIEETLDSIKEQSYINWHLYIVNDGSTDNTSEIVKEYINKNNIIEKITYLEEENSDQLEAIKRGFKEISNPNSLVYICHSDDLIHDREVFKKVNDYFTNNKVDAIISDLVIIDENSKVIGQQKVKKYVMKENNIALQGLWLGRNLFVDVAFYRYQIIKEFVLDNYLTWNTPFWLVTKDDLKMLNVQNVNFPLMKYRQTVDNYINNEMGMLNVLNGELRCALKILKHYHIPFYKEQYYLFRLLNKIKLNYVVFFKHKEQKHLGKVTEFIVNKRIKNIVKYPYYVAIINYFNHYPSERKIIIKDISASDVFEGAAMRQFNKLMLDNKLSLFYLNIFEEMVKGFKYVVTTKKDYDNLVIILKFLDIYDYVEIEIRDGE